jgi:hypothetical protein
VTSARQKQRKALIDGGPRLDSETTAIGKEVSFPDVRLADADAHPVLPDRGKPASVASIVPGGLSVTQDWFG